MKNKFLVFVLLIGLFFGQAPAIAEASDLIFHFGVTCQTDGTWNFEVWYNDHVLWRLAVLSDGARPVLTQKESQTTHVAPYLDKGFFMLKIDQDGEAKKH